MYDTRIVEPMRAELTNLGVMELKTSAEVDEALGQKSDTVLLVVNSVCGCAAGGARPGVALAMKHSTLPGKITTVFAGQDKEATDKARSYILGYPPSSPSMAIFKDGKPVYVIQRHEIEGRSPEQIAQNLTQAFDKYCG